MLGDGTICLGTERYVQGRNNMSRDGTTCPGTERCVQGRNDMSRDGTRCPGTERYVQGRNEGRNDMLGDGTRDGTERNGTKRNEGRNGTIISKNVKIPMRTLYCLYIERNLNTFETTCDNQNNSLRVFFHVFNAT
jgi:hypothetical protein